MACTALVALVAWPFHSIVPPIGGDQSWLAVLSYAAHNGLNFGSEVVWSYGPLGFLDTWYGPFVYYGDTVLATWLFAAGVQLLLAGTLLLALRRSFPLAVAAVLAAVVLALAPERTLALGFAWCALVLTRGDEPLPDRAAAAFPIALGVVTGIGLLGKLNTGLALLTLAVITLVALPRRRDALAFAAATVATALAGWLLTGQSLADAWPYVRDGAEVIAGYTAAMALTDPPYRWAYVAAPLLAAGALALAWTVARDVARRPRWGFMALCAVFLAFNFKAGFVRMDEPHLQVFFGGALVLFAVLPLRGSLRPLLVGGLAASVVALAVIAGTGEVTRSLNPVANVSAVADQARMLASPSRRTEAATQVRNAIAAFYGLSPELPRQIGDRTVMFWPFLFGELTYAYDLRLRPLPTLEPYAAYTPRLDRLSAQMLASPTRAPARVLRLDPRVSTAIDGRNPTFEAPLATLQILCRYRHAAVDGIWQLLARTADRCGAPRTLGTVTAPWGESVAVPEPTRPDALVLARVEGAELGAFEQLQALVVRPNRRWIALDGTRYRLVAATAPDGLVLRVPPQADYPAPFAIAADPRRVAVSRDGGQPGGELRYTFEEIPIAPFPAGTEGS